MERALLFILGIGLSFADATVVWLALGWANSADARVPNLNYWACCAVSLASWFIVRGLSSGTSQKG